MFYDVQQAFLGKMSDYSLDGLIALKELCALLGLARYVYSLWDIARRQVQEFEGWV